MKAYIAFVKKEILEQIRTSKLLILVVVFLAFGIISPLLAKLTPEIFKMIPMEGISITIPEPTALDSYGQFFKNVNQMGIVILILMFGNTLSNEISRGTLINMLTKGLSRSTVIAAKFTANAGLWTLAYAVSFFTMYGYTVYLFPNDSLQQVFVSVGCVWLFGVFLIALIILGTTITKGNYGGILFTLLVIASFFFVGIIPKVSRCLPLSLVTENMSLINGSLKISELYVPILITITATIASLWTSSYLFRTKQL